MVSLRSQGFVKKGGSYPKPGLAWSKFKTIDHSDPHRQMANQREPFSYINHTMNIKKFNIFRLKNFPV